MTTAAAHARHLSLLRMEQAAGRAFGFSDDAEPAARTTLLVTPTTLALATLATTLAATIGYLI